MSILVDRHTRVLVQGLTGAQGAQDTRYALDAGTQVVCGVTPGKGGAVVHGLPVYHTVAAAAAVHAATAAVVYAPPLAEAEQLTPEIFRTSAQLLLCPLVVEQHAAVEIADNNTPIELRHERGQAAALLLQRCPRLPYALRHIARQHITRGGQPVDGMPQHAQFGRTVLA